MPWQLKPSNQNSGIVKMDEYEWKKTAITVVLVLVILIGLVYAMMKNV